MCRYEHLMMMKDKFTAAALRTTGFIQSIWLRNIYSVDLILNSLTIEEAQEILK